MNCPHFTGYGQDFIVNKIKALETTGKMYN